MAAAPERIAEFVAFLAERESIEIRWLPDAGYLIVLMGAMQNSVR